MARMNFMVLVNELRLGMNIHFTNRQFCRTDQLKGGVRTCRFAFHCDALGRLPIFRCERQREG